jgi:hypothetical protein
MGKSRGPAIKCSVKECRNQVWESSRKKVRRKPVCSSCYANHCRQKNAVSTTAPRAGSDPAPTAQGDIVQTPAQNHDSAPTGEAQHIVQTPAQNHDSASSAEAQRMTENRLQPQRLSFADILAQEEGLYNSKQEPWTPVATLALYIFGGISDRQHFSVPKPRSTGLRESVEQDPWFLQAFQVCCCACICSSRAVY